MPFYRAVGLAAHVLVSSLVALVVARRTANAWVGVAAGSIILFLGSGWQNILWPFQIGFLGSIAATLGMMLCLERRARRADIVAGVLLAAALHAQDLRPRIDRGSGDSAGSRDALAAVRSDRCACPGLRALVP